MSSYQSSSRAHAAEVAARNAVYKKRRFFTGLPIGAVIHLVFALALGFVLVPNAVNFDVRLGASVISCAIATPAIFVLGFALMLSGKLRAFGGGIVVGALLTTLLLVVPWVIAVV
ncbi:hypothetical protein [Natronoglycomyces albus]|uniref:Uncharacterized protein n=1 Tax=Natronoglycomyces albus TaxID=2811108 RepID=A0A895XKF3_9ACTN|nr:hypothetical protein [Natronoglycomyces albus]QSB04292.1 hypothetical protein JQS30_10825 [Natronoglycomyces albus]